MRYEVTLRGARGASETVCVEAVSGDDAAEKAFKPYHIVTSVQPASETAANGARDALRVRYEAATGKKPFNGWSAEQLREKIFARVAA